VRIAAEHIHGDDGFASLYPAQAGVFSHDLAAHPLLTLEALAKAAEAMNADHVEVRRGNNGAGDDFAHAAPTAGVGDIIRTIAGRRCWVMLRFAEQLPAYRALLTTALAPLAAAVERRTGPMHDQRAFIFISSGAAVTPFHCDPEYNILFQIAGQKSFATWPPAPPFLNAAAEERLHAEGANMLAWDDGFTESGTEHRLDPGQALFVPYKAPHLVRVIDGPSVSLSLTWKSDWSLAQGEAHRFNAVLRRIGLHPRPVPPWPAATPMRTMASKLLRRAGMTS
jgi:hypothetical protein